MKNSVLKKIAICSFIILLLLVLLEVGFRLSGYRPQANAATPHMRVVPNTMFAYDSIFGNKMNPGHYTIYQPKTQYDVTINTDGYRVTALTDSGLNTLNPAIIFLGGPSMFGHGINDNETCPFFVQSLLPQYKVVNLAMPNSGLADNYLQLTRFPYLHADDLVVYVYHSLHDNRGKMSNLKRLGIAGSDMEYRFVTLDTNLTPHLNTHHHAKFPLSAYSALTGYLDLAYNRSMNEDKDGHLIAEKAILTMNKWCIAHNSKFVLVYWQPDKQRNETIDYCNRNGIKTIIFKADISFKDLVGHQPLAVANKAFADSLISHFTTKGLIDTTKVSSPLVK